MLISVIISTYNWPSALQRVLECLNHQQDKNFEIIVADDGSDSSTKQMITIFQENCKVPLTHVWQEDLGFRAAAIRNKAAAIAKGDYLIFIDGDCLTLPTFIGNHRKLAEKKFFVSGNRILLSEQITLKYITENISVLHQTLWQWIKFKRQGKCNRWSPLLTLRLGIIRKLRKNQWQGVKTCNLALFREDFIAINGMDENYQGWGFEDSDLVVRLQNNHVKRKDGRYFVPVIHLWHPHNRHPISSANNFTRLQSVINSKSVRANIGMDQYLSPSEKKPL